MNPAMIYDNKPVLRLFNIGLSDPPEGERQYRRNVTVTAVCSTAERAIELAKQEYPNAMVWQVNHIGEWANHRVIVDKEQSK